MLMIKCWVIEVITFYKSLKLRNKLINTELIQHGEAPKYECREDRGSMFLISTVITSNNL